MVMDDLDDDDVDSFTLAHAAYTSSPFSSA